MVGKKGSGKSTFINTIMSSISDENLNVTKECAHNGDYCTLEKVNYPFQYKRNGDLYSVPITFTDMWGLESWDDETIDFALKGQIPNSSKMGNKITPDSESSPPNVIFLLIAINQFKEEHTQSMKSFIKKATDSKIDVVVGLTHLTSAKGVTFEDLKSQYSSALGIDKKKYFL